MRRISLWFFSTLSVIVLLFSYRTSTDPGSASAATAATSTANGTGTGDAQTYTGDSVDTRWGPVQVRITVVDGKITASEAVVYPTENHRDIEINEQALPVLADEVVSAQSADIDLVSGATVTSDGYVQSLQSALDEANL